MHDEEDHENPKPPLILSPGGSLSTNPYTVLAHNRRVQKGWEDLCERSHQSSVRCHEWLSAHPDRPRPKRCYQLKHKNYQGAYCYEIGSGDRVYYTIARDKKEVLIYYAGEHPTKAPYPPEE
jgi:mRNA-degrading endonuclease RelE of RelBE toxin-antitoxin system